MSVEALYLQARCTQAILFDGVRKANKWDTGGPRRMIGGLGGPNEFG